ncbi:MAG: SLBB domain-containing protein [Candidatus Gastranaerophilales bacterium]|nr:SLBB domain-containing protein [Candidatus Gastranaerophilales bacterium]
MEIAELSRILRENGIVGAGGAGFPTYGKLSDKADTVLMNCAECEPLLKLHRQLLAKHAHEIMKAFALIAETVGAKEAIIGIKEEYQATIRALEEYLGEFPNMRIHKLPGAYPMGDEVVLIYEATGRVVRPGGLPIECGIAVFNVETLYNVYRAVWEQHPVTDKCVTIVGEVERPVTVRVPIGTRIRDVVAMAGQITTADPVYLLGGPMMGGFGTEHQPVTKTTNAVIVLPEDHILVHKKKARFSNSVARAASSCCQCQTCTDLCPRHALGHPIEPHLFMRSAANRDFHDLDPFLNTYFCSSCGLCEMYSCPQGLSPRSMMAEYKGGLRKAGVKPPTVEADPVKESREYRRVPEKRLLARLGLVKYEREAPLDDSVRAAQGVKVLLSQHIGAPAQAAVKAGDQVSCGQMIAAAAEGLSVNIHAPIDGKVTEVTKQYITIE